MISALSIPQVGEETAYDISKYFNNDIEAIIEADEEDFLKIYGVGTVVAESINDWFGNRDNIALVRRLLKYVRIVNENAGNNTNTSIFQGKSFVFTGTMPNISRDEAESIVRRYGGDVSSAVSKKTSYVVAGNDAGTKLAKAEQLGIKILDEDEFKALLPS
jgi:DNA ligase (NAD+)